MMESRQDLAGEYDALREALGSMTLAQCTAAYEQLFGHAKVAGDRELMARCLSDLAVYAAERDGETARTLLQAAVELAPDALTSENLARLELRVGRREAATQHARQAFSLWEASGCLEEMALSLDLLARCAGREGVDAESARLIHVAQPPVTTPGAQPVLLLGDPASDSDALIAAAEEVRARGGTPWSLRFRTASGDSTEPHSDAGLPLTIQTGEPRELPQAIAAAASAVGIQSTRLVGDEDRALWSACAFAVGGATEAPGGYLYGRDLTVTPAESNEPPSPADAPVLTVVLLRPGITDVSVNRQGAVEFCKAPASVTRNVSSLRAALGETSGARVVVCESVFEPTPSWLADHAAAGEELRSGPVLTTSGAPWFQTLARSVGRVFWPAAVTCDTTPPTVTRPLENTSGPRSRWIGALASMGEQDELSDLFDRLLAQGASWRFEPKLAMEADHADGVARLLAEAAGEGRRQARQAVATGGIPALAPLRQAVLSEAAEFGPSLNMIARVEAHEAHQPEDPSLVQDLREALELLFDHEVRRTALHAWSGATCDPAAPTGPAAELTLVRVGPSLDGTTRSLPPSAANLLMTPARDDAWDHIVATGGMALATAPCDALASLRGLVVHATISPWIAFVDGSEPPSVAEWRQLIHLLETDASIGAVSWSPGTAGLHDVLDEVESLQGRVVVTRRSTLDQCARRDGPFDAALKASGYVLMHVHGAEAATTMQETVLS